MPIDRAKLIDLLAGVISQSIRQRLSGPYGLVYERYCVFCDASSSSPPKLKHNAYCVITQLQDALQIKEPPCP